MKSIKEMTIAELAAFVCSHLRAHDINCVLTGGACITIYTHNKYQSFDIDFIDNDFTSQKKLKEVLGKIDFYELNRYFKHKDSEYIIEFPTGPLSIGSQKVKTVDKMEFDTGILNIISPTDSMKDRLAAYFYWEDKQSLEQAEMLCKDQKINIKEVERWAKAEGQGEKFKKIKKTLTKHNIH